MSKVQEVERTNMNSGTHKHEHDLSDSTSAGRATLFALIRILSPRVSLLLSFLFISSFFLYFLGKPKLGLQ
jgi:hypothetical protein